MREFERQQELRPELFPQLTVETAASMLHQMNHQEKLHLLVSGLSSPLPLRVMAFYSHIDDDGYGAGGFIYWLNRQNNDYYPYYLTKSNAGTGSVLEREREAHQYNRLIGNQVAPEFFPVHDGTLTQNIEPVFYQIKALISQIKPHLIVYLSPDTNPAPADAPNNYRHPDHFGNSLIFRHGVNGEPGLLEQFSLPGVEILSASPEIYLSEQLRGIKKQVILQSFHSQRQHLNPNITPLEGVSFYLKHFGNLNGKTPDNLQGINTWLPTIKQLAANDHHTLVQPFQLNHGLLTLDLHHLTHAKIGTNGKYQ